MKIFFGFITLTLCLSLSPGRGGTPPNLLVIMTDDLRIDMLGSEGHPYLETPHLDRLVTEGVTFNHAYALTPVCGPSRASIFTGQHPSAHMRRDNFYYPEHFEFYFPQQFRDAGYETALIGKYYEGDSFRSTARKAWDRWFVHTGPDPSKRTPGMSHYEWWTTFLYKDQMYSVDGTREKIKGHQTDILFDEASRFVLQERDRPFFLFLSPFSPHDPFNMTDRNRGRYEGKGLPPRENLNLEKGFFTGKGRKERLVTEYEQYCEMIKDVDDKLGDLLNTLEQSGQLDNTFILFTSDNGLMFGEHGFAWKRHAWEESTRVPFYVRYPDLVKPGTEMDAPVCLADILYTCAELAGVKLPEVPMRQGTSLLPLLTGEAPQVHEELIFCQYEKPPSNRDAPLPEKILWASLLRPDGWKYTVYNGAPQHGPDLHLEQLFHLSTDGFELRNLAEDPEYGERTADMKQKLKAGLKALNVDEAWIK